MNYEVKKTEQNIEFSPPNPLPIGRKTQNICVKFFHICVRLGTKLYP